MPKCLICGYESRSLQPHLKHKHQMRVSEYYEKFNNSPVYDYNPADNIQNGKLSDADVLLKKNVAEEFCQNNPQYSYIIITEKSLYSLCSGEITKSAQQELSKLLMI